MNDAPLSCHTTSKDDGIEEGIEEEEMEGDDGNEDADDVDESTQQTNMQSLISHPLIFIFPGCIPQAAKLPLPHSFYWADLADDEGGNLIAALTSSDYTIPQILNRVVDLLSRAQQVAVTVASTSSTQQTASGVKGPPTDWTEKSAL